MLSAQLAGSTILGRPNHGVKSLSDNPYLDAFDKAAKLLAPAWMPQLA